MRDFFRRQFRRLTRSVAEFFRERLQRFLSRTIAQKALLFVLGLLSLTIAWATIGLVSRWYEFRDHDENRGGVAVGPDLFGDEYTSIIYLEQNWTRADSLWFYNTSQGSDLLPYDFFLALETKASTTLFRDQANILGYRYLPQKSTKLNPDGLPVGFALDTYGGKRYVGLTCAACHTTQINFNKVGIRIDGGPAMADMESFMTDLAAALEATALPGPKRDRFVSAVLARHGYRDEASIISDLARYTSRVKSYTVINEPRSPRSPLTSYGFARLDAFGRIYNRVLEHLVSAKRLGEALKRAADPAELKRNETAIEQVLQGKHRDHLLERVEAVAAFSPRTLLKIRNQLFNPPDAPVSYPFLWDIPQHDYVQWNGVVQNAGIGPMGRNAGQVIGVFGTLDWEEKRGFSISSIIGGQGLRDTHVTFKSSIDIRNLRRVEKQLRNLWSPQWPETVLPPINRPMAARGESLFEEHCEACHQRIDRKNKLRRVVANLTKLDEIGTDPKMAKNSVERVGFSGILEGNYVGVGPGNILLERKAPLPALLAMSTANVVTTPDPDKFFIQRWAERLFDFAMTVLDNTVQPSLKRGNYAPDTDARPLDSLYAYKARSLNGIWATAPYLHNGSIPTLYHLLLPKKQANDPADGEYRPDEFVVGSREFDADKVGLRWSGYEGFHFRTEIPGNDNSGHDYGTRIRRRSDGTVIEEPLTPVERVELLEFLKTL